MLLCNQRTYLITQLKRQGLPQEQLKNVFDAIIVSRLLYSAPAWPGYLSSAEIDCFKSVLDKAKRWKLLCNEYNVVDLLYKCDRTLFKSSLCINHSLNHLFPDERHHYNNNNHASVFILRRLHPDDNERVITTL